MHPQEYRNLTEGNTIPADNLRDDLDATTLRAPAGKYAAQRIGSQGPPIDDDDWLLTSAQIRARVGGVSTMCIWRWMRDPNVQFPQPVKIGGKARNYWRLGDIRSWQAQRTQKTAA